MPVQPPHITADTVLALTAADYDAERAAMADALFAGGASAVYEIGSVACPGISDLDVIARFPDHVDRAAAWPRVAAVLRRARGFLHAPWALPERHWAKLPSLFAVRQLRDLATGATCDVAPQTSVQQLVWNVEASASVRTLLQARRRVTTRSALCLLNGVRYNAELAGEAVSATAEVRAFGDRITALRRHWAARPPDDRLDELRALWVLAASVLDQVLAAGAAEVARELRGDAGVAAMRVPGTGAVYDFGSPGAARHRGSPPANVVGLPRELGALFAVLAGGTGLERWLAVSPAGAQPPLAPAFAAAVRDHAVANAEYLRDMLAVGAPFLRLGGGTFAHLGQTRWWRWLGMLQRVRGRLVAAWR